MLSTTKQELAKFIRHYGIEHGKFTLASGQETDTYVNIKKVASHPKGLQLAVSLSLFFRNASNSLRTFFVRKKVKEHGTQKRIEGDIPEFGSIIIVEDVITTGNSVLDVISTISNEYKNCKIVKVISIVDRNPSFNLCFHDDLWNIPYCSLLGMKDLENSKVSKSESEKKFTDYCINDLSSKLNVLKNEISNLIEYVRDWIEKQNSSKIDKCYVGLVDLTIVFYVVPTITVWDSDLSDLLAELDIEIARIFKCSFEIREWPEEISPSDNKLEIFPDDIQKELEEAADRLDEKYKHAPYRLAN